MSLYDLRAVLDFLSNLSLNNDRTWFEEHKAVFEKARLTFEKLVDELIRRLSAFEDTTGLTAKDCVMRIYRDIRFSKDKTPYKTWMAALIAAGGRRSGRCGYGLHLSPGATMAGGGLWEPRPEQLALFRQAIDRDVRAFSDLIGAPEFVRTFGGLKGEKLKGAPKGYAKDHPAVELLRLKEVYVVRSFPDRAVIGDDFVDQLVGTFRVMKPFLDYLNSVAS